MPPPDALLEIAADRADVLLPGLVALAVVAWPTPWRLARIVVTIVHEGGHAVVAVLVGRGLTGIRLHPDTSGLTVSTGAPRGPGLVATFLAGYPAPAALGLGGAALVAAGYPDALLWTVAVLLAATLVHVRNLYGALVLLVLGAAVGALALRGPPDVRAAVAAGLAWFLMFGAVKAVAEMRRGGRAPASDAEALARLTRLPGGVWTGAFWLVTAAAPVAACWLLLAG